MHCEDIDSHKTGKIMLALSHLIHVASMVSRCFGRSVEGDAYVTFSGETPKTTDRMAMRAVGGRFDFTDMQLIRVVEG